MTIRRYFKMCEEFKVCCASGDVGELYIERKDDNYTMYEIFVRGKGRLAKIFDSDYIIGEGNGYNFHDMKKYLDHDIICEALEPFLIFGFNSLERNQDWDGKLITESFDGDDRSWLICFNGNPVVNGKQLNSLDYAKLENKRYDVNIKDGLIGVFTKL